MHLRRFGDAITTMLTSSHLNVEKYLVENVKVKKVNSNKAEKLLFL
jgi:hypothetical protein